MDYTAIIESPVSLIGLKTNETHLLGLDFLPDASKTLKPSDTIAEQTAQQLAAYFKDPSFSFDLPLLLKVTPFQHQVLMALQAIPSGSTEHYGSLATKLGTSPRPIGMACRRNPISIIIPCHRVTAKTGLGGFGGETSGSRLNIKTWLLRHEHALT